MGLRSNSSNCHSILVELYCFEWKSSVLNGNVLGWLVKLVFEVCWLLSNWPWWLVERVLVCVGGVDLAKGKVYFPFSFSQAKSYEIGLQKGF